MLFINVWSFQLLVLSSQRLLSLVELPTLEVPGGGVTAGLTTARSQVRLLLRDLSGKACWDASILYCSPEDSTDSSLKCWAQATGKLLSKCNLDEKRVLIAKFCSSKLLALKK